MHILQVIASLDPAAGGPTEAVLRIGELLEGGGHRQSVVCLDAPDAPWILAAPRGTVALGRAPGSSLFARAARRYKYNADLVPWLETRRHCYDAIIVNGLWNYTALAARRALTGKDTPYFVFVHGMLDPWFRKAHPFKNWLKQILWLFSEGPLLAGAEAVLFTAEDERRLARGAFWPYRCCEAIVGLGTNDIKGDRGAQKRAFHAKVPGVANRPFLLFLSRIHKKKGCDLLIEAFAQIAGKRPDLDLVIAGPDPSNWMRGLKESAARCGIADRIHWPGVLTGDAKWGAFACCEAFVLPSHQENFGIVVAEAMACSAPVLTTSKVNIWREVQEGGGGLIAQDDLFGVTDLLERFLALSDADLVRMGKAARATFLEHFSLEKNVSTLIDLLSRKESP